MRIETGSLVTELSIWLGIKNNDINALKELYQRYYQTLFNYGKKMTKDQQLIEDAIQETFVSVWKYRVTTSVPASVKQYLLKTFRNQLVRLFRQQPSIANSHELPDFLFEVSFDQKMIAEEDTRKLSAEINKALSRLTSRQREIIYYRFYENLSFEEIAAVMDMQTRATYKLTARALNSLRELLGSYIPLLLFL